MTTEEKLKHFEEAALERAKIESQTMLADYTASLQQLEEEHKTAKKRQADLQIKTETVNVKRERNKALSKEQLEIKRVVSKKQNELKEKLFAEVKTKLEEYMATPAYEKLLIGQIQDIKKIAGSNPVIIYIDPADVSLLPVLAAATNTTLTPSGYSFLGGTRAVLEDRHILIDNSFASKLEEERAVFTFNGGGIHE